MYGSSLVEISGFLPQCRGLLAGFTVVRLLADTFSSRHHDQACNHGTHPGTHESPSKSLWNTKLTIELFDDMQVQGKDRLAVAEAGRRLGLDGTYIARSYIEQVTAAVCTSRCMLLLLSVLSKIHEPAKCTGTFMKWLCTRASGRS